MGTRHLSPHSLVMLAPPLVYSPNWQHITSGIRRSRVIYYIFSLSHPSNVFMGVFFLGIYFLGRLLPSAYFLGNTVPPIQMQTNFWVEFAFIPHRAEVTWFFLPNHCSRLQNSKVPEGWYFFSTFPPFPPWCHFILHFRTLLTFFLQQDVSESFSINKARKNSFFLGPGEVLTEMFGIKTKSAIQRQGDVWA